MSTASAAAASPASPAPAPAGSAPIPGPGPGATAKPRHTLSLTRAGLYLLEGCLQETGPCTTPAKIVLWSKVWAKVRGDDASRKIRLSYAPDGHDVEKPMFKDKDETDLHFQTRVAEWNEAFKAWQEQPVTLELSEKYRDACKEAVKWVFENAKDGKSKRTLDTSVHSARLLVTLGLGGEESLDDADA